MKTPLLPTQVEDVKHIAAHNDIPNFSEPGTGKTLTTIGAIEATRLSSGVIVCPTVATLMWIEKLEEELGAKVQWLKTRTTKIDKLADFLVMSYGVLDAQLRSLISRDNAVVIADESHYLKTPTAKRTQAMFGQKCTGNTGLVSTSSQCWVLTGTPIERYADDLWSQVRACHWETLSKFSALTLNEFQNQFCMMQVKEYNGIKRYVSVATTNKVLLNSMIYNHIGAIRRTMDEVEKDMPETTFREVHCNSAIDRELQILMHGLDENKIEQKLMSGDEHLSRARRLLGLSKLRDMVSYIMDIAKEKQVLVGFWHQEVGIELYKRLHEDFAVALISGSTSTAKRDQYRKGFILGDIQILLGQTAAMGVAMDGLQVAHHIIITEDDWSASRIEQFYKRVARKGQRSHVQVDFLRSLNPIDKVIRKVRINKAASARTVLTAPDP